MLSVEGYTIGMVQTNVWIIGKEKTGPCIVCDPADYGEELFRKLSDEGKRVDAILLTHGHYDHILGVEGMRRLSKAAVVASTSEEGFLLDPHANLSADTGRPCTVRADRYLRDGEHFSAAGLAITCIHTPGHTEGSCCFLVREEGQEGDEGYVLLAGDTLFYESVGRTDLPTGSTSALIRSIKEKLLCLPDACEVLPGHGPVTTIGHEKEHNYFLG